MNNFSWPKAIGFGAIIWAIMTVSLWILGSIPNLDHLWVHGLVVAVGAISAFFFAQNAKAEGGMQAATYGIVWAAMVLVLDLVVTQWFDVHILAVWQYWLGIVLVFLSPWVQTETRHSLTHTQSHQV